MFRDDSDARHPASPARLQAARADGDVAVSRQLSGAIQLLGVLVLASMFLGQISGSLRSYAQSLWSGASTSLDEVDAGNLVLQAAKTVGMVALPLVGLLFAVSVLSHIAQTGPLFLPKRVNFDATRLSPHHWLQRVFSASHLMAALMDLPKLLVVLGAAGVTSYWNWRSIVALGGSSVGGMVSRLFGLILKIGFQTALILFFFGVVDYGFRWSARQRRLRMSDEQVREEQRMQSGNAQTTDRRRRLHRELTSSDQ